MFVRNYKFKSVKWGQSPARDLVEEHCILVLRKDIETEMLFGCRITKHHHMTMGNLLPSLRLAALRPLPNAKLGDVIGHRTDIADMPFTMNSVSWILCM